MRTAQAWTTFFVVGAFAALTSGCNDGPAPATSSTEEATVTGTVTIKGKTATKGTVTFDAASYQRPVGARSAEIGKDGSYTIKTYIGHNAVRVSSPLIKGREMDDNSQSFIVKSGDNRFDIQVPPADQAGTGGGRGRD